MSQQPQIRDYKTGIANDESASGARHEAPPPIEDFLQRLARAVRYLHTYPTTSPLCAEAIASCHTALTALDQADRLSFRITPRELVTDAGGIGAGTIVEHEVVRRLHRAGVASLDIERAASSRDLAHLCESINLCDGRRDAPALADRLVEQGVETIVARMARRPEVLNVGVPPAPVRDLVDHEQRRRRSLPSTGPVDYLYPPEKGWVRLDPAARLDTVSLVDLAVLVNDPADMATMLLRLTDDDPVGAIGGDEALEQKFADLAMLFAALDGHLARVMFGKLARAVLSIEGERRSALLRRTILPGLLDGRADGAVLRDFPDPDLAESLCLLLELETAAPEVVGAALDKLDLPAERRHTVAAMVDARLHGSGVVQKPSPSTDATGDRYARRLVKVEATPGTSFAEFAAFDLSIDAHTADLIAGAREAVSVTDTVLIQLGCLQHLVRLEPSPTLVGVFMGRAVALMDDLAGSGRWDEVADAATSFRRLTYELKPSRRDAGAAIERALAGYWTAARIVDLVALQQRDPEGRAIVSRLVEAFGAALAPGCVAALGHASVQAALASLMCDHALLLAPGLVDALAGAPPAAARAIVRVLGSAGAGYEAAIASQLTSDDDQVVRAALRALARIGSPRAAALVSLQIQTATKASRAAEEALWHFAPQQTMLQLRDLLSRRDFVVSNPDVATRLMERAAQSEACDLGGVLEDLESLRFRVWNPDLRRVALKARGLRGR